MSDQSLDLGAAAVDTAEVDEGAGSSLLKGSLVVAVVVALAAVLNEAADFVQDRGWVSSVNDAYRLGASVLVAAAGVVVAEALGVVKHIGTRRTRYAVEFGVIGAFVGLVALAYVGRDPGRIELSRSLTAAAPSFTHTITEVGRSGDRFQISVRALDDSLDAQLIVSRGVQTYVAEMSDDRTITFDRVLVGDRWHATVKARNGSTGRFLLEIEAHSVEDVAVPSSFVTSLADAKASRGYVLDLPEPGEVYIGIRPQAPAGFRPSLEVRSVRNLSSVYTKQSGTGWEAFERLPAGRYVIVVHESAGRTGTFELMVDSARPAGQPARGFTTPTPGARAVPDVFGLTVSEAEEKLSAAGLSPVLVDVCSSSVPGGHVRQVYVAGAGAQEKIVVDAPARRLPGTSVPAGSTVYVKVGTGVPCA